MGTDKQRKGTFKNAIKVLSPMIVLFLLVVLQDITNNNRVNVLLYDFVESLALGALLFLFFWKIRFVRYPALAIIGFGLFKMLFNVLVYLEVDINGFAKIISIVFEYFAMLCLAVIALFIYLKGKKRLSKILGMLFAFVFVLSIPIVIDNVIDIYENTQTLFIQIIIAPLYFILGVSSAIFPFLLIFLLLYEEQNYIQ